MSDISVEKSRYFGIDLLRAMAIVPAVCVGAFALALVKRMLFSLPPLRSYR